MCFCLFLAQDITYILFTTGMHLLQVSVSFNSISCVLDTILDASESQS